MTYRAPIYFEWNGEAMRPLPRFLPIADKMYDVGQVYRLETVEERSGPAHRRYHAALHEAWLQLPENKALEYPTETHLRRWALIATGYADERTIVCDTEADAARIAAIIKPLDSYAVVVKKKNVVKIYTAKSQSYRAMGNAEFNASADAVLAMLAKVIGVTQAQLTKEADKSPNQP